MTQLIEDFSPLWTVWSGEWVLWRGKSYTSWGRSALGGRSILWKDLSWGKIFTGGRAVLGGRALLGEDLYKWEGGGLYSRGFWLEEEGTNARRSSV